jgi:hypothetical protein
VHLSCQGVGLTTPAKSKALIDLREKFAFDRISNDVALICDVATKEATRKSKAREAGGMSGCTVVFRTGASKWSSAKRLGAR